MSRKYVKEICFAIALLGVTGLAVAGGRPLVAYLDGANEVPPSGSDIGFAAVTLNQGKDEICFDIETDIDGIIFAHIHAGVAGENGPVVVNLDFPNNGLSGCVSGIGKALIKEIRKHPELFYINVHNSLTPSGRIRGQLEK